MANEKPTLGYALPTGGSRPRVILDWLSRRRRVLIVIAVITSSLQVSRMVQIVHHTELEMCRYCGSKRTADRRTIAGFTYRNVTMSPRPYTIPPPKFLDPGHAHDWRGGGTSWERRGNVWGLGDGAPGAAQTQAHCMTEEGLELMSIFRSAPVEVQRDIYADIAACGTYGELDKVMNAARAKYGVAKWSGGPTSAASLR